MIVERVTPAPRFTRGNKGDLCLTKTFAVVFYAENKDDEERLTKIVEETVK